MRQLIFVSSPQRELARLRRSLCYGLLTDPYFKEYFDVFLFENLPANGRNPEGNYLEKVEECSIYLGLIGRTYGTVDPHSRLSATEVEFDRATELRKDRLVFVRRLPRGVRRERRMAALLRKVAREVTFKEFTTADRLLLEVKTALLLWQQRRAGGGTV